VAENLRSRQEAAHEAEEIIQVHSQEFMDWLRSLDAVALIQDYRHQAEVLRDEVLERALRQLQSGKSAAEAMRFLAHTLTNKLLHTPSAQIRQAGANGQNDLLEAANTLLQLRTPPPRP
jgi:glutamyl-tRNA reductase